MNQIASGFHCQASTMRQQRRIRCHLDHIAVRSRPVMNASFCNRRLPVVAIFRARRSHVCAAYSPAKTLGPDRS